MVHLACQLDALYEQVPATRCASSGECCALTEEEFESHFATMFPLYRAEYQNVVEFVELNFAEERQRELFDFVEERPRRCPFLSEDHRCSIYPVRPLICRTYAVMNSRTIAQMVERYRDKVPEDWIDGFVLRESGMACPRVRVVEPEKLEKHAENLINFTYERELVRLSSGVEIASGERRELFEQLTGRRSWPLRWSWGGFNAIRFAPLDWVRSQFKRYWKKAELPDAG